MRESGKRDEARTALDELLPGLRSSLPRSSLNLFLSQRLKLARNLDEFLVFAPRIPSTIQFPELAPRIQSAEPPPDLQLLDVDAVRVLNEGLPMLMLRRAAQSKSLLQSLHTELVRAVRTRAILVGDGAAANELAADLAACSPELKTDLNAWSGIAEPESRQFAAAMLLLHFPGMSPFLHKGLKLRKGLAGIDIWRENWWCGLTVEGDLERTIYSRAGSQPTNAPRKPAIHEVPTGIPDFLADAEKASLRDEWHKLSATQAAANFIGRIVLAWAA